ncbi:cap-specific mRNA (nucleoside-2'-O-)-methyltransferase 1-like [Uranotaenia lowii]|uniref:cap-specific mRNA (nucleoside-2'-O-)-methyltransferase 1-like n=1 Tax=Uranotaenia lowii TaxID=190385 RepID=UPI00247A335D|nr:cap-specific mRNA (nucleoside-2'-O-)-methyltransferase 1-like [Uranotaenia lowii]
MISPEEILAEVANFEGNFRSVELSPTAPVPEIDTESWLEIGLRKNSIDDETKYCTESLLRQLLNQKSTLDQFKVKLVERARQRSTRFDIRSGQFMNRAAVKIANVDAMFEWRLCQLSDQERQRNSQELFYFVDVFGGPGGCSEYILWRNGGWHARGFGFTTKGEYEFRPDAFRAGAPETLDPYYGRNDNGNIFDPENIIGFVDYVLAQTKDRGAHLLVCDGGFYIKSSSQEILSKRLYLCLVLLAVGVIRTGGRAIIKVFDLYTPFSVGLVYILYRCYGKISIVKPISSRPANSERYLVCQNRLNRDTGFAEYLISINQVMWDNKHLNYDILEIVSKDVIAQDIDFTNFIRGSNEDLARRQIEGLKPMLAALSDDFCAEKLDQRLLQTTLWKSWKLDQNSYQSLTAGDGKIRFAAEYALQFIEQSTGEKFTVPDTVMDGAQTPANIFGDPAWWSFIPVDVTSDQGKTVRTIFLSKGNGNTFVFDRAEKGWKQIKEYQLVLSPKTLLYGEIVEEIFFKNDEQKISLALHIIDAMMLGGTDIRHESLAKRNELCAKFAMAHNRPLAADCNAGDVKPIPVRSKTLIPMTEMTNFFNNLSVNELKNGTKVLGIPVPPNARQETKRFYIPRGLLFIPHHHPSKAEQLDFETSLVSRHLWLWLNTTQIYSSSQCFDVDRRKGLVYRYDIDEFLEKFEKKKI